MTFFFGLPCAVEGLTRFPFQNRRASLFFGAANKEKNEASWSLSPEAPPGGVFLQTPDVLLAPANFPPRGGGGVPEPLPPHPPHEPGREAGGHTCAGSLSLPSWSRPNLSGSGWWQVAGVTEPQGPVLAGVSGSQ